MSLILGAIGGAGEGLQQVGAQAQKANDAQDLATVESNLALQRTEALEQFKTNLATQQRQTMVNSINAAVPDILNQGMVQKAINARAQNLDGTVATGSDGQPAQSLGFTGDASSALAAIQSLPDGPDKQAALAQLQQQISAGKAKNANLSIDDMTDQEKAQFAPSASDKRQAQIDAAISQGYISPTDVMKTASQQEITQLKMQSLLDRASDRNATMQQIANVRADAMQYGYELRLQAAQERAANGRANDATTRMLITSEDANIRASTSQLGMLNTQLSNTPKLIGGKPNPQYDTLAQQMDALRADISQSKQNKVELFRSLNIMPAASAPTPNPAPTPGAAVPANPASATRPPLSSFLTQ